MSGALLHMTTIAPSGGVIQVSDIPTLVADLGGATTTYRAELEHRTTGRVWENLLVGSDTNEGAWIVPDTEADPAHAVKYDYGSGDNTHNVGGLVDGVYQAISATRSHGMQYTSSGGSDDISQIVTFTVAYDTGGTGAVTSGNITINVGEIF